MSKLLASIATIFLTLPAAVLGQQADAPASLTPADAIAWASTALESIKQIDEYSCVLLRQERLNGELLEREIVRLKIRNPTEQIFFSFHSGRSSGIKMLRDASKHDGRILNNAPVVGDGPNVSFRPNSYMLMRRMRHPITEWNIEDTAERFVKIMETEKDTEGWEIRFKMNIKINGRKCTRMEIRHPRDQEQFRFHLMRLYVDDEFQIPIRITHFRWPETEGSEIEESGTDDSERELVESYTFTLMNLEPEFTDKDFEEALIRR